MFRILSKILHKSLLKYALLIHEENAKEIMAVKDLKVQCTLNGYEFFNILVLVVMVVVLKYFLKS